MLATWCEELTHWKKPWCWKYWRWEKGTIEDEMVAWHHQLNGHEFEWTPAAADRQGKPGVLQSMGSQRVRHDWVTELNSELLLKIISWSANKVNQTKHCFIYLYLKSFFFFFFWVRDKGVDFELATPEITQDLLLMSVINNNDSMVADDIRCLLVPCIQPSFNYLLFIWCSSISLYYVIWYKEKWYSLFSLYRWDDQSSLRLSNMFITTQWCVTSGDLNPILWETVWSVLKPTLFVYSH